MTQFGDLTTEKGQQALNEFLATRSYIEGYTPSQSDVATLAAFKTEPSGSYAHCCRWYRHIKSFSCDEVKGFPGSKSEAPKNEKPADDDDDDDMDLFGDDSDEEEETEEEKRVKEERLAAYHAKKEKKPALVPKSTVILDVKPWDDETDMAEMERLVRTIQMDGLVWGQGKLVPVGYGIKKLQISCVIEDDKVSTDILEEEITGFTDHVQSMDIAAFNKV